MFERLVTEATDPTVDTHGWESTCNFIIKIANDRGAIGQATLDAVQKLQRILRQRMGPFGTSREYRLAARAREMRTALD